MPLKAREVTGSLATKFGFSPLDRGDKHQWLQLALGGVRPVTVMFSHGDRELGDVLLGKICKQLRVSRPYLTGMLDCHNTSPDYRHKLTNAAAAGT